MDVLQNINNQISYSFMLVISSFTLIFFIVIYFSSERYKSILLVVFANAIQLIIIILSYLTIYNEGFQPEPVTNIMSSVQVTLWMLAIFVILRMKVRIWPLVLVNIINLAQGIVLPVLGLSHEIIHLLYSICISAITLYCVILVMREKSNPKMKDVKVLFFSLTLFIVFHLLRGGLCFGGLIIHGSFESNSALFKFMNVLRYAFSHLMNFVIIYLNFNYLIRKVEQLSHTDKLTGALNRSFFIKMLEVKLAELKRSEKEMVIAILDIDNFKSVNDTYGHLTGDKVLRGFTDHLKENIRQNDIICRYGGEEFLILMEITGKKEAELALRRLQDSVRGHKITEDEISLTFSCGMEYLSGGDGDRDINEIIKLIDFRLYQAKNAGKDRIVL